MPDALKTDQQAQARKERGLKRAATAAAAAAAAATDADADADLTPSPKKRRKVKVKAEPADNGKGKAEETLRARHPQYYEIAQLPYDDDQYELLYHKYMDGKEIEREMESETRSRTIRFSTVRKWVTPLIERYPSVAQRVRHLLTEDTDKSKAEVLLLLRQLQYFEAFPPSLGGDAPPPTFDSCMHPIDLSDLAEGEDPMEVAVRQSITRAEALSDEVVIDVDSFIIDELKLVVVKSEKEAEEGPTRKRPRTGGSQ